MVKPRLIPVLLLKNGLLVRSQNFRTHQIIGNPESSVARFSNWNVDELVILDISSSTIHDLRRNDLKQDYAGGSILDVISAVAEVTFMPLAVGGRILSVEDIKDRLGAGADKCIINSAAVRDPALIGQAADRFGSQCIVISIDAKRIGKGNYEVFIQGGQIATGLSPAKWAAKCANAGCGEILLNSIDRDGTARGYDIDLIQSVVDAVNIPVIACGGVGHYDDFAPAIVKGGASAAAAANIFHFYELSYPIAKRTCIDSGVLMRPNKLGSFWLKREPVYDQKIETTLIDKRIELSKSKRKQIKESNNLGVAKKWCQKCIYSSLSAVPVEFDDEGICMGCRMSEEKMNTSNDEWSGRLEKLRSIIESRRAGANTKYDCIIPVSGGKDSYFQTHIIKMELGFNPLLVTYDGNNYTETGWRNLKRMQKVFDVDHIIVKPPVKTLIKLNKLAFFAMGDMNWHAHMGITTIPIQIAVKEDIPILIWGEHGYTDLSGQFSTSDFPEMTYRDRLEHFGRGFEWNFFNGQDGLTEEDLRYWKYPDDQFLMKQKVRGIYLGNYVHWDANRHVQLVIDKYGFETANRPFDRTYRTMSNLDDMHENGIHDYLKFIKFGYGRCTDHACKDIRAGLMSRQQAIELAEKYDPVKPSDLERWLRYVNIREEEFDEIADTFRDPRVWQNDKGTWIRENII